ncbi:MAG: DNA polymerase III subunit beta, partial [Bacteroidales bacterium]|nr:DNA polymerase III subunit beta [Bacteroidales bacterium]
MRFIVNSQVLLKHLQAVGGVISTNTSMPILENYLFDLRGSELSIIGSNAETTIMVTLEVESNEEGRVAIPSKMLQDIVKTFPDM